MSLLDNPSANAQGNVVLCVDDAAENLSALNMTLMSGGYTFVGATSGDECLRLVESVTPKLILLDVEMPGIDGFETCRRLRAIPRLAKIPIAFLTIRNTGDDVKRGLAAGGNDFLIKPFDRDVLLARVGKLISGGPVVASKPTPKQKNVSVKWD